MKNNFYDQWGLYILLIIMCVFFGLLIPFASREQNSSAQTPLVMGTYGLIGLVCGSFIIGLRNMFLLKSSAKRLWNINTVIVMVTGGVIIYFFIKIISV
jgi:hypothetical protein